MRKQDEPASKQLSRLIDQAPSILLATHRNPDGDGIGSLLGFSRILGLMGKNPVTYCPDGIPHILQFLPGQENVVTELAGDKTFDLSIILDTADENLYPDGFPGPDRRGTLVVIDHHEQHGEIGDLVIRWEASAVGEMLFDLAVELVWPIDDQIAVCLYTSIVSDTGSFRYSNSTPRAHRVAAELLSAGAQPWIVASNLFESYPIHRQRLLGEVLKTLDLSEDGRFASLCSTPEMLARAGAKREDLGGMVNLGRSVDGVEISAMFRLEKNGEIKVSFRSKGLVDVGRLAVRFTGGGHRNAAGCTLRDIDMDTARRTIREAADELLAVFDAEGGSRVRT